MTLDQKQQTALFRYGVIAPLITGTAEPGISNRAFFRQAAEKNYPDAGGTPRKVSASTIEKWYAAYKKGGFDALLPSGRSDAGISRKLDDDLKQRIRYLKKEHPRMTAAEIFRKLRADGSIHTGEVSQSTVERFVRCITEEDGAAVTKDMRRYEREHINEVWCGDTCYGPYLQTPDGKKRVYIIALIDDASRYIVGADLFFQDRFENLMTVIRSAVSKHGRPGLFNFDNGSVYHNMQMELLAARIGSAVHFNRPYTPVGKAKIERWFSTAKMQYFSSLDMRDFTDLEQFRDDFAAYVRRYNQSPHSSLGGRSPQDRFFEEPQQIHRLTQDEIEQFFLLEIERRVSADSVVMIGKTEYEVHYRYAKQRIRIRYSPDMEKVYVVEPSGELVPVRLLNKLENASVKREKVHLSGGDGE